MTRETDPYRAGLITANPFSAKADVRCRLVAVMSLVLHGRRMQFESFRTRVFAQHSTFELAVAADGSADHNGIVPDISYIGFCEVLNSGVLAIGDEVWAGRRLIGHIAGFDSTHMPNHYNVIAYSVQDPRSGAALDLEIGSAVCCRMRGDSG